jgi:hypothetical protein
MTGDAPKTPRPDPEDDADLDNEGSSVRPRVVPDQKRRSSGQFALDKPIDELLRVAKAVLARLPADHPRASLLRVALWRRDAPLLRGLLEELGPTLGRNRATLLPPPRDD